MVSHTRNLVWLVSFLRQSARPLSRAYNAYGQGSNRLRGTPCVTNMSETPTPIPSMARAPQQQVALWVRETELTAKREALVELYIARGHVRTQPDGQDF